MARYEANASKARVEKRETDTQAGQRMLTHAVVPTTKAIETFLQNARSGRPGPAAAATVLLEGLPPRVVALHPRGVVRDRIGGSSAGQDPEQGLPRRAVQQRPAVSAVERRLDDVTAHVPERVPPCQGGSS